MSIPVVFVHGGYAPYLEFTLRQAAACADSVILLGDATNDRFPFVRHVDAAELAPDATARLAASYVHRSTNTAGFERFCLQRWLQVAALMERDALDRVLVLDSDVLLFATSAEVEALVGDARAGLATPATQAPFDWETSGHSSLWTRAALSDFSDFVLGAYTDDAETAARLDAKWHHHVETGAPGGVSDMALLHLWAERQPSGGVCVVTEAREGVALDHNVSLSLGTHTGDFRIGRDGLKELVWRDGQPHAVRADTGETVRLLTLHLQGPAKRAMGDLYHGPDFPQRSALAGSLRRYHSAKRWAGRAKYALWRTVGRLRGRR